MLTEGARRCVNELRRELQEFGGRRKEAGGEEVEERR